MWGPESEQDTGRVAQRAEPAVITAQLCSRAFDGPTPMHNARRRAIKIVDLDEELRSGHGRTRSSCRTLQPADSSPAVDNDPVAVSECRLGERQLKHPSNIAE